MNVVKFKQWLCVVKKEMYKNGITALTLYEVDSNEKILTATVNLSEYGLVRAEEELTFIKNWSENEGVLECLVENGIVENLHMPVPTGFVMAHMVKVLI